MFIYYRIFGGTTASQEIMSLFYHLQKWKSPISFIVDEHHYSITYMDMIMKILYNYNITQYIYNITSSEISTSGAFHLFEKIRSDIPNGGLIVLLVDDDKVNKELIQLGYKYMLSEDNSEYYMMISNSPEFTYLQLGNSIKYNKFFFLENYDTGSMSTINLNYINFLRSYFGIEWLYDDNNAVLYTLTEILYTNYIYEKTISFETIKYKSLVKEYNTIIGTIEITNDLYVSQKVFLRHYNKEGTAIVELNEGANNYYPYPFAQYYNSVYYYCNEYGEKDEYPYTIQIAFIHPFTGSYKDLYSSVAYAFTISSDFFIHILAFFEKYIITFYDCGDDMNKLKEIVTDLINKGVVAIFGGYPSLRAREIITRAVKNTDTMFIYFYDTTYKECYNKNFIILGTSIHHKLITIGEYIDTSKIMNTNFITGIDDSKIEGWYANGVFEYIMASHYVDYAVIYDINETQFRVIFDEIRSRNQKSALIIDVNTQSSFLFYSELYKYSQLYPGFEYEVFDINMDYFTALQYPVEYIINSYFMSNFLPSYNLPYYSVWIDDSLFSYIKLSNISSVAFTAAYSLEFYSYLSNSIPSETVILEYDAPEGMIRLENSNSIARYIRIGQFYNNSNKLSAKLAYTSDSFLESNPYYHYHYAGLYPLICDVYNGSSIKDMIILIFLNDGSEYLKQIYRGMSYVVNKYVEIMGYSLIPIESPLNNYYLDYYSSLSDEVMFFGCITKECTSFMEPFLQKYNRTLFSFNEYPGTCSTHIFSTVKSKPNVITTLLNHFYSKNVQQFILLAEDHNDIYATIFRSYTKLLGFHSYIMINPSINRVRNYLDGIIQANIFILNTISYLSPSVFNYISSKSRLDTFSFCTIDLYKYYNNDSYYTANVITIDSFFTGVTDIDFKDFEDGFYKTYDRVATYFNYIGYNAAEIFYNVVKDIKSFDLLNNLGRIVNRRFMVGLNEQYINKYLSSTNNLYIIKVNESNELVFVAVHSGAIESYMSPYPWYLDAYSGLLCLVDYETNIASTKKIQYNIIGLVFSINSESDMPYTRPIVLTIINAINYYIINGINIFLFLLFIEELYTYIVTYDCLTKSDYENALSALTAMKQLKIIIGGMSKYEAELVNNYINGTDIIYFSVVQITKCIVSKNLISPVSPLQSIYPAIEYITNNGYKERIILLYSKTTDSLIDRLKIDLHHINITYYLIDEKDYKNEIDNFINKYNKLDSVNIISLLYRDMLKYFADRICEEKDLSISSISIFYANSKAESLTALNSCISEVSNYIISTYDEYGLQKYIDEDGYIFDNNITHYLIYEYYQEEEKESTYNRIINNEEAFTSLIYVEYIKYLFSLDSYTLDELPIYNLSINTPYSTISLSSSNVIARDLYFTNFTDKKFAFKSSYFQNYDLCFNNTFDEYHISKIDYEKGDDDDSIYSFNKYIVTKEIFPLAIILENKVTDITPYERAYLSSIRRFIADINRKGGIMDHYLFLKMYYYQDLIPIFANMKITVFFGVLNYKYIQQYFLQILYLTNKILIYLLPYSGEVCEKNIIFMNYFPYELAYHFTNFVIKKNRNIIVIYNTDYHEVFSSIYPQLSNYPFESITALAFDLENELTKKPIIDLLKNNTDIILLLFGPILYIDSNTFDGFINIFNTSNNMIITDLCTVQIEKRSINLLNNFYMISPFFESLANTSNSYLNVKYSNLALEVKTVYKQIYSDKYLIEYPQYISITTVQLINRLFSDANSFEINDHLWYIFNNNLKTITPYGLIYMTVGRKAEQLLFIAKFNIESNNIIHYDIEYSQETEIYPYNFNPYVSNKRCLLNVDVSTTDQFIIKILFILSPVEPLISINMFSTFYYQLIEINKEKIYKYRFQLFSKSYTTTEELKEIVQYNQEEYFAYVGFIFPYHLEQVRYDFNKTILFHITGGTKQSLLQSNIISFSFVNTVASDTVNDQLKKMMIKNIILVGLSKCPIYLFVVIILFFYI